jgi:hypothetical protein
MADDQSPFADIDLSKAIALRWILRDIKGKRLKLLPVDENDLHLLIDKGLVEIRNDEPVLTPAGLAALD